MLLSCNGLIGEPPWCNAWALWGQMLGQQRFADSIRCMGEGAEGSATSLVPAHGVDLGEQGSVSGPVGTYAKYARLARRHPPPRWARAGCARGAPVPTGDWQYVM